jgi:NADPH-dependent glutamate synthase beta subunit-like oxidoreductase
MTTDVKMDKKDMKSRMQVPRQKSKHLDPKSRTQTFEEVNKGMPEESVKIEIFRCITCKSPKCMPKCPINNEMYKYLDLLMDGKIEEAIAVLKSTNPMPAILGRICPHPCETECVRGLKNEPVSINAIERYLGDMELKLKKEGKIKRPRRPEGVDLERVAVIGAGPAGLTAAYDLGKKGYRVTVFEKSSVPGGMLYLGIPEYRLPREIIMDFIADLESLDVEFKYNTPLSKDLHPKSLLADGYKAVFIGIGAYEGKKMDIPGEGEYEGFEDCIVFLGRVNLGDKRKPGRKVLVIGGGNSAIDAARTALRLGSDEVHIVYRRSRKEMPANPEEIDDAEAEGVKIHYLAAPIKILGKEGKVAGMEVIRCELGEPDASGRRRPVPVKGSEYVIEADIIVPAISQQPDPSGLPEDHGLNIDKRWMSFVVDEATMQTNMPGVFAAGDAVTGPQTVVQAIAAAHKAAEAIDKHVRGQ